MAPTNREAGAGYGCEPPVRRQPEGLGTPDLHHPLAHSDTAAPIPKLEKEPMPEVDLGQEAIAFCREARYHEFSSPCPFGITPTGGLEQGLNRNHVAHRRDRLGGLKIPNLGRTNAAKGEQGP